MKPLSLSTLFSICLSPSLTVLLSGPQCLLYPSLTLPSIHPAPGNPVWSLSLPSSSSCSLASSFLPSPLLSSLLVYQSPWQEINIGCAAALLSCLLRPSPLTFRLILRSAAASSVMEEVALSLFTIPAALISSLI